MCNFESNSMADPIEAFLSRLQHPVMAGIDYKLERMQRLLALLRNPEKRLPPVIHVAGTNGKGSLIAYLKAIFEARGLRVHVYTSPHLVEFRERIVIAGKIAENAQIQSALAHIAKILPEQPATFFEAATAAAFLLFAEKPADILLLETGVGGRLDATNVIDKPILTAITPISFDHMEYLGDDINKIAGEKAGIMKPGVTCVVGKQIPEAMRVLEAKSDELNAPIVRLDSRGLAIQPSLAGAHQFDNAATAIACIDQLPQFGITDEHILQGISHAVWPARLQKLTRGPLRDMLPAHCDLYLDGGHNAQGGEVLGAWLRDQQKPIYMICGMVQGKAADDYLAHLAPHVRQLYAIAIPGESTSQKPETLLQAAKTLGINAEIAPSPQAAMQAIVAQNPQSALVVIGGSLYLAGHILRNHG